MLYGDTRRAGFPVITAERRQDDTGTCNCCLTNFSATLGMEGRVRSNAEWWRLRSFNFLPVGGIDPLRTAA
jgi:hypothetical protein